MSKCSGNQGTLHGVIRYVALVAYALTGLGCTHARSQPIPHARPGSQASQTEATKESKPPTDDQGIPGVQADFPLHTAAAAGDAGRVKHLLETGADINAQDGDGQTPLHKAAVGGHTDVVKLLLDKGADAGIEDRSGETVGHAVQRSVQEQWRAGGGEIIRTYGEIAMLFATHESFRAIFPAMAEVPSFSAHGRGWVKPFLDQGGTVDARDEMGRTPLHAAAGHGHMDDVKLLLEQGADVMVRSQGGETPLHSAAGGGQKEMVEFLLARGADVNAANKVSSTPLHQAGMAFNRRPTSSRLAGQPWMTHDYAGTVEVLLQAGAAVSGRNYRGETPLHIAAVRGFKDVLELLLAHGADMNARNNAGQTPLDRAEWAVSWRQREIDRAGGPGATYPSQLAQLEEKKESLEWLQGQSAFDAAKATGHTVKTKTEKVVLPCEPPWNRGAPQSPLFSAQSLEAVKMLLARGENINKRDGIGATLLHHAAASDDVELVEFLLDEGIHVNTRDRSNETPLHWAAGFGQAEVARTLLAHGAEVNARSMDKNTPLHWAAGSGQADAAKTLIAHGADVNATDLDAYTPLHTLVSGRFQLVWAQRKTNGTDRSDEYLATAEVLLDNGAAVNAKAEDGETPLHFAADQGDHELVKVLLAHGANANARSDVGATPLHSAASGKRFHSFLEGRKGAKTFRDYPGTVTTLLKHGAEVNATDHAGYVPLHSAAIFCDREAAKILLEHGADLTATCHHGETPLTGAERGLRNVKGRSERSPANEVAERTKCYEEMIAWLKEHGAK